MKVIKNRKRRLQINKDDTDIITINILIYSVNYIIWVESKYYFRCFLGLFLKFAYLSSFRIIIFI